MRASVDKLEKTLRKRVLRKNKNKIKVREIVAYQKGTATSTPMGEFKGLAKPESEKSLIKRMGQYIEDLFEHGATQHVAHSFQDPQNYITPKKLNQLAYDQAKKKCVGEPTKENIQLEKEAILSANVQPTMDPNKKNNITRLSLHEFALYPKESHGPLTLDGLKNLIKKLKD